MSRKVLQENWEDEEQMVSNLLQFPTLIPEDIRMECIRKGLTDLESPYYILSAAVGLQRISINNEDWKNVFEHLKNACFHDIGVVSMRSFMSLQPKLSYPNDIQFIMDILKNPRSALFQNAIAWLIIQEQNREDDVMKLLRAAELPEESLKRAEKLVRERIAILKNGEEDQDLSLQFFDYIPNLNDFEAMLDKQDTLVEFFHDLDINRDGKVSLDQVQSFLEDIGKHVTIEELEKDLNLTDTDATGDVDKDTFIELMFPRFQMRS
eukprot:gene17415-19158_t